MIALKERAANLPHKIWEWVSVIIRLPSLDTKWTPFTVTSVSFMYWFVFARYLLLLLLFVHCSCFFFFATLHKHNMPVRYTNINETFMSFQETFYCIETTQLCWFSWILYQGPTKRKAKKKLIQLIFYLFWPLFEY